MRTTTFLFVSLILSLGAIASPEEGKDYATVSIPPVGQIDPDDCNYIAKSWRYRCIQKYLYQEFIKGKVENIIPYFSENIETTVYGNSFVSGIKEKAGVSAKFYGIDQFFSGFIGNILKNSVVIDYDFQNLKQYVNIPNRFKDLCEVTIYIKAYIHHWRTGVDVPVEYTGQWTFENGKVTKFHTTFGSQEALVRIEQVAEAIKLPFPSEEAKMAWLSSIPPLGEDFQGRKEWIKKHILYP